LLERGLERVSEEAESVEEIALSRPVATDEDRQRTEVDLASANALVVTDLSAAQERAWLATHSREPTPLAVEIPRVCRAPLG
jgi:hypothetical protein